MSQQQVGPPGAGRGRGMTLPAWMTDASFLLSALQFRLSKICFFLFKSFFLFFYF
jgi:hypothetical protein